MRTDDARRESRQQFGAVRSAHCSTRAAQRHLPVFGATLLSLFLFAPVQAQQSPATQQGARANPRAIEEVVVTAQKREESINDVGMSIQATSGDKLKDLGINDTSGLFKAVSGFNANLSFYGTPIYTIRGVGFQDTSLAAGPTVSVYLDEAPIPFSVMTQGAVLDLERVEVLKGPQGTLFGENSTGGAINYIAKKPSQDFDAGIEASYGRFDDADITGAVGGPLTDTLSIRLAARAETSSGWQKSYTRGDALPPDPYWVDQGRTYRMDSTFGEKEFYNGRLSLLWEPTDQLSALFTLSGFIDKGDSQMPQLFGFAPLNPINTLNPLIANYPIAPDDARAADWGPCVNVSGGTPANVTGEVNLSNRLYDNCKRAARDNDYYAPRLRVDYDLSNGMTVTSLTSWEKFNRDLRLEGDSTIYQDYESHQTGYLEEFFQELRLSGSVADTGSWVVGGNYEWQSTWDSFLQSYGISTAVPTQVITATPLGPTNPNNRQKIHTYAAFANLEYPVMENVMLQGGVRYTNQKRDQRGCGNDGGDGTWSAISAEIQTVLQIVGGYPVVGGVDVGPGACATTGPPPTFEPVASGFKSKLDEDNISWRINANWTPTDAQLWYANISQGYKSGSFPTVATSAVVQLRPATQEKLLAYEVGTKLRLLEGTMQLNAAAFYYDYEDKQILGAIADPTFGSLPALVNVPNSHVIGGELDLQWYPIDGLRLEPSVSYAKSEVDGTFFNYDPFFGPTNPDQKDFSGEKFPNAPTWTANFDAEYDWNLQSGWTAFFGGHVNYQSDTVGFFYDRCQDPARSCTRTALPGLVGNSKLVIPERTLLDLRAGVENDKWRIWAWGENVTDEYYWTDSAHVNDALVRYTGMPRTYGVTVRVNFGQ